MNATILQEIAKLTVEERRALIDALWDSIETEQALPPLSEELARLLDERYRDSLENLNQKAYTLEEIAGRHGIKL
jgi:putative addiction module component (TIGR02574 family)